MKLLYVNACARKESRTKLLAQKLLEKWNDSIEVVNLYDETLPLLDEKQMIERGEAAAKGDMDSPYVRYASQFAQADVIVIAAPFWDMGFPAILKTYIETIMMTGITFTYTEEGFPKGLCKARKLIYVTTAGGPIPLQEFGYAYIEFLARQMWGIEDCQCIKAEGLDIVGVDVNSILKNTEKQIDEVRFM